MPIDTARADYNTAFRKWERCRDVISGSDAVKLKTVLYLPKLEGHTGVEDPAYRSYLCRAEFYNASGRTVQGMSGAVFRKPPSVSKLPTDVDALRKDITRQGRSLDAFASQIFEEDLKVGRLGVLVEMPTQGATNMRPYWVLWKAEQIVNWQTAVKDGQLILTRVVLKESIARPKAADPYQLDEVTQYRELFLDDVGHYTQRVWTKAEGSGQSSWVPGEDLLITRIGQPLDFIPFVFINGSSNDPDIENPPLLDLVDVNLSHYRSSADYEHGAHFTALPQAWVVGAPKDAELAIGSGVAWVLPDSANSKAAFLEYTGQGLGAIERVIDRKEKRMAVLGARLLEQQPTMMDTATAARLRQSGDESVMTRLANTVSAGLTRALQWTVWWMSSLAMEATDVQDAQITLNTDLIETKMDPQRLTALMGTFQGGAMSMATLFWNLQQGEMIPPGRTLEEEVAAIEAEDAKRAADPMVDPTVDPTDTGAGA